MHPEGPTGTARAGMMLADVMPALNAEAAELRDALQEVRILRELQLGAADTLQSGLDGAQAARTALSTAIPARTDPPNRYIAAPVQTAHLLAVTEARESLPGGPPDTSPETAGRTPRRQAFGKPRPCSPPPPAPCQARQMASKPTISAPGI